MSMLMQRPIRWLLVVGVGLAVAGTSPAPAATARGRHRSPSKLSDKVRDEGKRRGAGSLDVIVRFKKEPGTAERSLVQAFGGTVRRQHRSRWMTVRVPGRLVEKLADDPAIEFVTVDAPLSVAAMDVSRATAGLPTQMQTESALQGRRGDDRGDRLRSGHASRAPRSRGLRGPRGSLRSRLCSGGQHRPQRPRHARGRHPGGRRHSLGGRKVCRHRSAGEPGLDPRSRRRRPREHVGHDGGAAVGPRPQERVRHPRPQPVARPPGLRVGRDRSARADGRGRLGLGDRRRLLGRELGARRPRHGHEPLQLAQGDHGGGAQRPPDGRHPGRRGHHLLVSRSDAGRPRGQARSPRAGQQDRVAPVRGFDTRPRASFEPRSRRPHPALGRRLLRAVGHEHGGPHGGREQPPSCSSRSPRSIPGPSRRG